MSIFVKREKIFNSSYSSNVQAKHRAEYDAAIDDALIDVRNHLARASSSFNSVIYGGSLRNEFAEGIAQAIEVLSRLNLETDDQIESE